MEALKTDLIFQKKKSVNLKHSNKTIQNEDQREK
jgi:hypothetical protein